MKFRQRLSKNAFDKLLKGAFHDVRLPDVSIVQQQQQQQQHQQLGSGDDIDEAGPSPTRTIYASKDEAGHLKWNWKFHAFDLDSNNCLLECTVLGLYMSSVKNWPR
jgi:hypothetical protein